MLNISVTLENFHALFLVHTPSLHPYITIVESFIAVD